MNKNKITKPIANTVGAGPVPARNQRGVTLVALIITIIVMLILVAVSVSIAIKGNLFGITKRVAKGTQKEINAEQELANGRVKINGIWYDSIEDYAIGKESAYQPTDTKPTDLNKGNTTFIYDPAGWTTGKVKIKIEVKEKVNGILQYSTDGKTWETYEKGKEIEAENNGYTVYARVINDKEEVGTVATGNVSNIDRLDPKSVTITNVEATMNTIEVVVTAEDADKNSINGSSGIAKYHFSIDGGNTWKPEGGKAEGTYTFTELTPNTEYTIKVKAEDKAGNSKISEEKKVRTTEMIGATGNVTFKYNPEGWTNDEVEVTIIKEEAVKDYALEYSLDNKTWQDYTGAFKVYDNGNIYARLKDSLGNTGGVATGNITNIDYKVPKAFTTEGDSSYDSITLTGSTTDSEATTTSGSSGIAKYYYSKDNGVTWEPQNGTTEESYTFDNLPELTTYTLKMKAVDNAKNERVTETITVKTKKLVKPEIGDYVKYEPDTVTDSYLLLGKYSGYGEYDKSSLPNVFTAAKDQKIWQDNLNWQVLKVYSDGSVDLIGSPTVDKVYFGGPLGYNNGVYLLHDICAKLYSNKSMGITARSISLEDFEDENNGGNWKTERDNYSDGNSGDACFGESKIYTDNTYYYPNLYARENGSGINTTTVKIDGIKNTDKYYKSPTEETYGQTGTIGLTVTRTGYSVGLNETNYGLSANVLAKGECWVASRIVDAYTYGAFFGFHCVSGSNSNYFLWTDYVSRSNGIFYVHSHYSIRPVVTLKAGTILETEGGTNSASNPHTIMNH